MSHFSTVLLILPWHTGVARMISRGIYTFCFPGHEWDIFWCDLSISEIAKHHGSNIKGAIGFLGRNDLASAAKSLNIPLINLHGGRPFLDIPQVGVNDREIGMMAARHLMDCGYRTFAYVGIPGIDFSDQRQMGFQQELNNRGFSMAVFDPAGKYKKPPGPSFEKEGVREPLYRWVQSITQPCGVFCVNDVWARNLSMVCRYARLNVPEQIGILGADDDDLHCLGAYPPISSIQQPFEQVGFETAKMLDRLMSKQTMEHVRVDLPPSGVTIRQSTNLLLMEDHQIASALRFMRERALTSIEVEQAARHAGLSRRLFERRFKAAVGRSPGQEIVRLKIEAAKERLRTTDQTLQQIAEEIGFNSGIYLSEIFKTKVGMSPGNYRRQFRTC